MGEYEITLSLVFYTTLGEKDSEDYAQGYARAIADLIENNYGDQIEIEDIKVKKA